jgi:hypothetical protein
MIDFEDRDNPEYRNLDVEETNTQARLPHKQTWKPHEGKRDDRANL